MDLFRPLDVQASSAIAAGAIAWRYRGAPHLTAIVKATFTIVPDGAMTLARPEPLFVEDQRVDGKGAVIRPSDRVPYRPRADVVVRAISRAAGQPARISLRSGAGAFEKAISAWEEAASLGPGARAWPAGLALDMPGDFDLARFQMAPPDQQTSYLRGDEWIVIEGLHPSHPVLSTRIPDACAGGVAHQMAGPAPWSRPLEMNADALLVDLAELRCTIAWRVSLPLASAEQLAALHLHLELGLELGGQPAVEPEPATTPRPAAKANLLEQTVTLVGASGAPASGAPASAPRAPASAPASRTPPSSGFDTTMPLTPSAAASPPVAAPFPIADAAQRGRGAPIAGAPWSAERAAPAPKPAGDFEHTLALRDDKPAPIAGAPWSAERAAPAPAPRVDLEHTLPLRAATPAGAAGMPMAPPPRVEIVGAPVAAPRAEPAVSPVAPPLGSGATAPPQPSSAASDRAASAAGAQPRPPPAERDPNEQLFRRLPKKKA